MSVISHRHQLCIVIVSKSINITIKWIYMKKIKEWHKRIQRKTADLAKWMKFKSSHLNLYKILIP